LQQGTVKKNLCMSTTTLWEC